MIRMGMQNEEKLVVQAVGKLGEVEISELSSSLLSLPYSQGPVRAFFHLEGLEEVDSTESSGTWLRQHWRAWSKMMKVALVVDSRLEDEIRRLVSNLVQGELRFFSLEQAAQARDWVDSPDSSVPLNRQLPPQVN